MDYEKCASEFIRAIRADRSQTAFARRLRYKSNTIYAWESGRSWPTAAKALHAARLSHIEPNTAVACFYRTPPEWLQHVDIATREGVSQLLTDLNGRTSIQQIARLTGHTRFKISRWLKGQTQPSLPDFFRMIEATSLRILDFIAAFVDPTTMPSICDAWCDLEAARTAAHDVPWTQAVLRALELEQYRKLPEHRPGWIAEQIRITKEEEERCVELLSRSGQIRKEEGHWIVHRILTVDTRRDPESTRRLREWWTAVSLDRIKQGSQGTFSYNVCAVSSDDFDQIRKMYRDFFIEIQSIVARSQPVEKVVVLNTQLFSLDDS